MPPLTLKSPRLGGPQVAAGRLLHRAELPPRPASTRSTRESESTHFGTNVVASALGGSSSGGVASSSSSTSSSSSSSIADAKASLRAAAPAARAGDPAAIATVLAAVERLAELALEEAPSSSTPSSPFPPPPEPSTWETLFTDAKQGSNGKVGPLQGEARQLFETNKQFVNRVSIPSEKLPLLKADFGGRWEQRAGRKDRVEVIFEKSNFYVAGFRVSGSEFPPPGTKGSLKGHWTMKFADDEVRAFVTNKMSVVVLGRVLEEEK